jgi:Rrf2 family protein
VRLPYMPKRVHHALQCLICLAEAQGPLRASELARVTGIPPAHAAKILYLLTWGGFVSSRRGSKGGFWLRVPSDRIRVQDVAEFFDPPPDESTKNIDDSILLVLQEKVGTGRGVFDKLTLANLVRESHKRHDHKKGLKGKR